MRLNKYVALATGLSRRAADDAIAAGRVLINDHPTILGQHVSDGDIVTLDGAQLRPPSKHLTIMLNKPAGYVCSRDGQGSKTIYDLLPENYRQLKPVGRLDKDSSGLLLLTSDGTLAYELTHPSFQKEKKYEVTLDHRLSQADFKAISGTGVQLQDGPSKLGLEMTRIRDGRHVCVSLHEGRNRQIRRTFEALGYTVTTLHRTHFGPYSLSDLPSGSYATLAQ